MLNDVFVDNSTGEKVKILKEDVNFYTLSNNINIKKDVFAKKFKVMEEVDPNAFFSQPSPTTDPLQNIANKIKGIDSSKVKDAPSQAGTQVKYTPPVVLSDNSIPDGPKNLPPVEGEVPMTPDEKKKMLEDWRKTQPGAQIPEVQDRDWEKDDERLLNGDKPITKPVAASPQPTIDPIKMMFKMFKNNYPVKLNIKISENIPNPTFIGMVQDNVDADAIEYYAKIISDKMLKEPKKLQDEIYKQLKNIINEELGIEEQPQLSDEKTEE